MKTKSFVVIML